MATARGMKQGCESDSAGNLNGSIANGAQVHWLLDTIPSSELATAALLVCASIAGLGRLSSETNPPVSEARPEIPHSAGTDYLGSEQRDSRLIVNSTIDYLLAFQASKTHSLMTSCSFCRRRSFATGVVIGSQINEICSNAAQMGVR